MHVFLFSLFKSVRLFLISVACITLAACGGGGGGSSDSPAPVITPDPTPTPVAVVTPEPTSTPVPVLSDTSPDIFTLSVESDAELHEEFTANVTVSGIDTETAITISGTDGEYKIDDGDYTIATGTVVNGQTVTVKATAADTYATLREITLTIGDQSDVFSVTTRDAVVTPADFEFTATTDAEPGSVNESNSISVAGIEIPVAISITGGEYKIDEGDYTAAQSTVSADQVVTVRATAEDDFATDTTASLTIGDKTADYVVTTREGNTTVNAFTFDDIDDAALSDLVVSAPVLISGLEVSSQISVTGGEYSIDGGAFTSAQGSIGPDNTEVVVRGISSDLNLTTTDVVLSIGEGSVDEGTIVSDTFTITTVADTSAPIASIAFPPQTSMTEGSTVFIRGTAEDVSGVATVVVDVDGEMTEATMTEEDGVYLWEATVDLGVGTNALKVITTDSLDNTTPTGSEVSVNVKSDSSYGPFPDSDNEFSDPVAVAVDLQNNRALVGDIDLFSILSIDLSTGKRSIFYDQFIDDVSNPVQFPFSFLVDENSRVLWVGDIVSVDDETPIIRKIDLDTVVQNQVSSNALQAENAFVGLPYQIIFDPSQAERILIADEGIVSMSTNEITLGDRTRIAYRDEPSIEPTLGSVISLTADPTDTNKIYVYSDALTAQNENSILHFDLVTGDRTVLVSTDDIAFISFESLNYDIQNERLIAVDRRGSQIVTVSATDGSTAILSDTTHPNDLNVLFRPQEAFYDERLGYLLVPDSANLILVAVDLKSGHRVIVSKN